MRGAWAAFQPSMGYTSDLLPFSDNSRMVGLVAWLFLVVAGVFGALLLSALAYAITQKHAAAEIRAAQAEAEALRLAGERDAAAARLALESAAREHALTLRDRAESELTAAAEDLARREERLAKRALRIEDDSAETARLLE